MLTKILTVLFICLLLYVFGAISALIYNAYLKKVKNADGIPWKECFALWKMFSVLFGFLFMFMYLIANYLVGHIFEQYRMRFIDDDCSECIAKRQCDRNNCGCDALARASSPLEKCTRSRHFGYARIMWSKKRYREHREAFPVIFSVKADPNFSPEKRNNYIKKHKLL